MLFPFPKVPTVKYHISYLSQSQISDFYPISDWQSFWNIFVEQNATHAFIENGFSVF